MTSIKPAMPPELLAALARHRLVPVVVLERAEDAAPLAGALTRGGLPVAEVTFRTKAAVASIAAMRQAEPAMLIGAGTVSTPAQVDEAVAAGASFIVTPGFNAAVVRHAIGRGIPIIPGANAPGFMEQAIELGLDVLKFFPAEPSGGVAFLKALAGPYPEVRFMPTGGISKANLASYLALPTVLACGGSWMVPPDLIAAGNFSGIEQLTREAVALVAAAAGEASGRRGG